MAAKPDAFVRPIEDATYRCPGCGEMVDRRRTDQVLQHHRHVLEQQYPPAWFDNTRQPSSAGANAVTKMQPAQTPAAQQSWTSTNTEAQRRRYGH